MRKYISPMTSTVMKEKVVKSRDTSLNCLECEFKQNFRKAYFGGQGNLIDS